MGTFIFSKKQGGFFPFSPHLLGLTPRHLHAGRRPRPSAAAAAESGEGPRWREATTSGKFGQRPPCPAGGTGPRCGGRGSRRAGRRCQGPEKGKRVPNHRHPRHTVGVSWPPPRARCASAAVLEEQSAMPGPWWTPPWPDWLHSPHEPARREPRVRHSLPGHREKFSHNLSAARNGLAAACLPSIPIVEDCQLPLRQWTERDSGSGALVLPPEKCITDRSHSRGAHCRRWFQHPRPERAAPGTGLRRRTGLPRSSPATTRLSPVVIAPQQPSGSWRRFWSEAPCAGLVLDDVPQPDARGAGSRAATPARERDREWQKDMRL